MPDDSATQYGKWAPFLRSRLSPWGLVILLPRVIPLSCSFLTVPGFIQSFLSSTNFPSDLQGWFLPGQPLQPPPPTPRTQTELTSIAIPPRAVAGPPSIQRQHLQRWDRLPPRTPDHSSPASLSYCSRLTSSQLSSSSPRLTLCSIVLPVFLLSCRHLSLSSSSALFQCIVSVPTSSFLPPCSSSQFPSVSCVYFLSS